MKRKDKAGIARVMGIKWVWDYKARKWKADSLVGTWHMWFDGQKWFLVSPTGTIYTLHNKSRCEAMTQAVFKIAEVERYLAGR